MPTPTTPELRRQAAARCPDCGNELHSIPDDAWGCRTCGGIFDHLPEPSCPTIGFDRCALPAGHDGDHVPATGGAVAGG